jgi:hypothetical protein
MIQSFHCSGNFSFIQTESISICIPVRSILLLFRFILPKLYFIVLNINVNLPVARLIYEPLIFISVCLILFIPSTSNNWRKCLYNCLKYGKNLQANYSSPALSSSIRDFNISEIYLCLHTSASHSCPLIFTLSIPSFVSASFVVRRVRKLAKSSY